jgi:hypothetical protein
MNKSKYNHKKLFILADDEKLKGLVEQKHGKRHKEHYPKYVYVLHLLIHHLTYQNDIYQRDGKQLNITKLSFLFGGSSSYTTSIIESLCQWGYIYCCNRQYLPNKKSRSYKLAELYESAKLAMTFFSPLDARFLKKLIEQERKKMVTPVEKNVKQVLKEYATLSDEGLSYLRSKYPSQEMDAMLLQYRNGDLHPSDEVFKAAIANVKVESDDITDLLLFSFLEGEYYINLSHQTRRLFHTVCNLKRTHRSFVRLQGRPMLHTDIVNSQVVISIPVIKEALGGNTPKDFIRYQQDAVTGRFYEVLAERAGIGITTENSRTIFKKQFFQEIFFSRPHRYHSTIKDAFKALYPSVLRAINKLKRGDYKRFSVRLQSLEADIMIFSVLKTLQEEGHLVLPLHDAIFCNNATTLQRAKELIEQEFRTKHGLAVRFKDDHSTNEFRVDATQFCSNSTQN